MNDSEFQSFCYEEYKRSLSSRDDIYRRYPFAVTAIVVLATATITLGSNRWLEHLFVRVDVSLYYMGLACAFLATGCATVFLVLSILPKDFEHLDSPLLFHAWRENYRKSLIEKGYAKDIVAQQVATETENALTLRFVEATTKNMRMDRAGMRPYNRAMYAIAVAVVALALTAVFSWIINYRGLP